MHNYIYKLNQYAQLPHQLSFYMANTEYKLDTLLAHTHMIIPGLLYLLIKSSASLDIGTSDGNWRVFFQWITFL